VSAPDPHEKLKGFQPTCRYFVGIDSDGCAFDTMEPKHKECFCPVTIWKFDLAAVSKYARDAWDFVNLYSKERGCNRFHALQHVMNHLRERPEVIRRKVDIPLLRELAAWTGRAKALGNPELAAEVQRTGDAELAQVLDWSKAINEMVAKVVKKVPPFPGVRESLEFLAGKADMFMAIIAGQEMGTKKDHLALGAGGKYPPDRILMIGDAPGDLKAAQANKALFYPINPGHEEDSWDRFIKEAGPKFLAGQYDRQYEARLIAEFDKLLPDTPPWKH
jgi:hypothetical protein